MRKAVAAFAALALLTFVGCKREDAPAPQQSSAATEEPPRPDHYKVPLPHGETILSVTNDTDNFYVVSRDADGGQHYRSYNLKGQLTFDVAFEE